MSDSSSMELVYRGDCLVLHVRGRDVIERMDATVKAMADAIRERHVHATLIDLRAVPGPFSFSDRYQLGLQAARNFIGFKVAALIHEEQADHERIGKLVAENRGLLIEVFTDPAAADAWLEKQSALHQRL